MTVHGHEARRVGVPVRNHLLGLGAVPAEDDPAPPVGGGCGAARGDGPGGQLADPASGVGQALLGQHALDDGGGDRVAHLDGRRLVGVLAADADGV
uniref:hypothetical protein n=1 Tax=Nonomuraea lactucae TaxID=2249762 RepID=UPI0019635717